MGSFLIPMFLALLLASTITNSEAYSTTVKAPFPGDKPDKLTHLHFYVHDTVSGNKPSSVIIVNGPTTNTSASSFGFIDVADDPMTVGPKINSKEVGRAQGLFASADLKIFGFLTNFNFVLTKGEFAGSTVAMYGRNPILSKVREMPIVGGTGAFRFGRGYAEARTFSVNQTSRDAVVEYDVYIWH